MAIADLLGGLPAGTTIKIGSTAGASSTALGGGTSLKTGSGNPTLSETPKPGDCDPYAERWSFIEKKCVPAPWKQNYFSNKNQAPDVTQKTPYQQCIDSGKSPGECLSTYKETPETPETPNKPTYSTYEECRSHALNDSYCRGLGLKPTGEEDGGTAQCGEGQHWDAGVKRCVPDKLVPDTPGEATETPSPFDNPEYYSWLVEPAGKMSAEELAYWGTQQEVITRTYEEGWGDIEAQISSMGGGYGTEMREIQSMYTRDMETALRSAYNEIMYTGLERRLKEKEDAINFYTNNKQLELSYYISKGQLTLQQLQTFLNADVAYAGLEIDMLRALTEQAVARSTIDVNNSAIYTNFMTLAMQLGLSNEEAEDAWGQILANYGAGQTSDVTM